MSLSFDALRPLVEGLPPIVMLSSLDGPGAGDGALRLHRGLLAAGADATTYVLRKTVLNNSVIEIDDSMKRRNIYAVMTHAVFRHYPHRPLCFELFSLDKSPVDLASIDGVQNAKLVHLHWIAGMVSFPQAGAIFKEKAVVWSLTDMNPLSGGCHYAAGCEKYITTGCQACPQLGPSVSCTDLAAQNFTARQVGYAKINMAVVAHSKWLTECSKKSKLLSSFPHATIPTCVDPWVFFPQPRSWARATFGIPHERKAILFGVAGIQRKNKGLHIIKPTLEKLRSQWKGKLPLLIIFGGDAREFIPEGYECLELGRVAPNVLAKAYSAADVYISLSFQDNMPNTVKEALSCGTPVICFDKFGSEDIVSDGITGFTVSHPGLPLAADGRLLQHPPYSIPHKTVAELAEKIVHALAIPHEESKNLRIRCSQKASEYFSPVLRTAKFLTIYRKILGLPHVAIDGCT